MDLLSRPSVSTSYVPLFQFTVELLFESIQEVWDGFLHADVSLQLSTQWSYTFSFNATRYNVIKPCQISIAVQSQTMRRDVAAAVDSWKPPQNNTW